jgi:hypothetical protein
VSYGAHPHSRRSRRVHRARDVRRPLTLARAVILMCVVPALFFLALVVWFA